MNALVPEPFCDGTHRAFLDGCAAHGRNDWTVLSLSPHQWKWRMRYGAIAASAAWRVPSTSSGSSSL